jgi:hypothetical protein
VREQTRVLDDVPDAAPQQRRVRLANVLAVQQDRAAGRIDHAVDHAQRGRLAAAGRPDEHRDLPRVDGQVEAVDRDRPVGILLGHGLELDHCPETPQVETATIRP